MTRAGLWARGSPAYMDRQAVVFAEVEKLYANATTTMGGWMWRNHTQWVAEKATLLANKYGANVETVFCAALLHDLGDSRYERGDSRFDAWSWERGKSILKSAGYRKQQRDAILEAVRTHSCHPGHLPITIEGKIVSTADGMWHLQTSFFPAICFMNRPSSVSTYAEWQQWFIEKIERDFHKKMFFTDEQDEVREDFDALKRVFEAQPLG